ncbi:hypothetical protein [Frankia sp. Cr1]|uniref:hypothetical protein n=1 Tax=Frankia sp. Cr1 TaxID=3073931 RepID=UPI002AD59EF7|nr:hypothetical protein [Frankia sp. Cr1]
MPGWPSRALGLRFTRPSLAVERADGEGDIMKSLRCCLNPKVIAGLAVVAVVG